MAEQKTTREAITYRCDLRKPRQSLAKAERRLENKNARDSRAFFVSAQDYCFSASMAISIRTSSLTAGAYLPILKSVRLTMV